MKEKVFSIILFLFYENANFMLISKVQNGKRQPKQPSSYSFIYLLNINF